MELCVILSKNLYFKKAKINFCNGYNLFIGVSMDFFVIKFKFICDFKGKKHLDDTFKKIEDSLNIRLDDDLNYYFTDNETGYHFEDISNENPESVKKITEIFFNFTFKNITDVSLYKFLFLKNNDKLTVLAIIHSSICDYKTIPYICELFNNSNNINYKNNFKMYLNSIDYKKDSDYWKKYLSDIWDYGDIKVPKNQVGYSMEKSFKNIVKNLNKLNIADFSSKHDISPDILFMSAVLLILDKYTYSTKSLLTNIYNRKADSQCCSDIADFSKELPLIIDRNNRSQSIKSLLYNVKNTWNNVLNHVRYPFERIFTDKSIVSTITFRYFEDYRSNLIEKDNFMYDKDLEIHFNKNEDNSFSISLYYNALLYTQEYMKTFIDSIYVTLNKILNSDINNLSIKDVELTDKAMNTDIFDYSIPTIVELFEKQVQLNSSKTALIVNDEQISYDELNQNANRIANSLLEVIDSKSRIIILLSRSKELIYSIWGVLKAGCSFIPLDESYPKDRKKYIIDDSDCQLIITDRNIKNSISPEVLLDNSNINNPNIDIKVNDIAYILYTSGTTGVPKGVCFSHQNIANIAMPSKDNQLNNALTEDVNRLLSLTAVNFSPAVIDFATALSSGLTIVYANNDEIENIDSLNDLINKYKPEIIGSITPSRLSQYLEIPDFVHAFQYIKKVILLGEKFPHHLYSKIKLKNPTVHVYNHYGSSETVSISLKKVTSDNDITVGWAAHNVEIYVVDIDEKILPVGVSGQLYISGPSVTLGYTNEDNSSYMINEGKMFFKTGDLATLLNNGELKLWGRVDKQIKLRGQRIEPEEIITIINQYPDILDNVVTVKEINGFNHLIAYYVAKNKINESDLDNYLKSILPDYMVPSVFIKIEEIPKNINGKLDVSKLPEPSFNKFIYEAPSNRKEELVVNAFKQLFNEKIGVNDDFIMLGGTSLTAIHILKYLSDYDIAVADILQLRTPKKIAKHLQRNNICPDKYSFDDAVMLSESQMNIYLDEQINEMGTGYNNPFKIEFNDRYSKNEVKNALIKLFDLHPILKARLVSSKEKFVSCVFDAEIEINQGKLSDIKSFVRQFELNKNLSRFLIASDGESTTLCCDIHHVIFDGTSLNILINTLFSILENVNKDSVDNGILRQISFEDLQNNAITYNQFFTAIFAYTMSRFTGSSKILFNLIVDGRGHIDLSDSVGMFAKTLPLLIDCKNQKVTSFLKYASKLINSAMKYDLYPFSALAKKYDLNNNILFQYSHDIFKNEACDLKHDLQRDMTFSICNVDEGKMGIKILYSDKFSKEFIKHFVDSYILILNEIMHVKELSDINFTIKSDLTLLDSYNHTEHSLMYNDILDAFNENLSKYPNNKLVSYNGVSYTYGESAFIVDKIARKLTELGVKSQCNIGFLVHRSELYMLSVLSILSVGAIYVPLDDRFPDERIKFMINDAETKVIIVSDETYERAFGLDSNCTILNVSDIINDNVSTLSKLPVIYGDLACILYTSGTTGIPKGVKITRKAIINASGVYCEKYALTRDCVYGMFSTVGFDIGSLSIMTVLYSGASLEIIPEKIKLNMFELSRFINDHNITHISITAQVAKLFMRNDSVTSLRVLSVGGEKLGKVKSPNNYMLMDEFGPTESFAFVSSINNSDKIDSSSIGYINKNMKFYVLDDEFRRIPIGAVGELYLSGIQIAEGYLNRKKETQNAFIKNPFCDDKNYDRLYRTGDMVRVLPDGSLGIVGRRDSQVKIRGNRVELSEVEAVIRRIDYIDDVSVQPTKIRENNELVAYVVVSGEIENLKEDIQDYVERNKPDYMIPLFVIRLDEIPLTVNGKVDKNKLPKVDVSTKNSAPQNSTEKKLLKICGEVLDNKNFGVDDNLASLGISSLHLIDLNHRIYSTFNIDLIYFDLVQCKNIRDIYNLLNKNEINVFKKYEKRKYYPLTEHQNWVSHLRIKTPNYLKLNFTVQIKDVDVFRLKKSFIKFMDRHPFLKSTLIQNDGEYYIKREDDADISNLIVIDRKNKREFDLFVKKLDNDSQFLENYLEEEYTRYDSKFIYCRLTEYKNTVFATILFDHLFSDYYSLFSMLNEIDKIYFNEEDKIEPEIIDGFDYTLFFVNDEKKNAHFNNECKKELFDYGDLYITPDRQGDINPLYRSNMMHAFHNKAIQEYCKKFNIKYNQFFLATFVLTIFKFCGLKKGFVPVLYNGRIFNELRNTYYCTVKPIFLKMEMYKWNCINDVFANISDEMIRVIKTEPNTSLYLFYENQWIFNFIAYSENNFNLDISDYKDRANTSESIKKDHENYLNEVIIFETEDYYVVNLSFRDKYYTGEYIAKFLNCWDRLIEYIISEDDLNIGLDFPEKILKNK